MEAPHLTLSVSENALVEGAKEILSKLRSGWDLERVRFKVFTDGITNKLLGCFNSNEPNDVILIRVYGNKTDLLIDRKAETQNIKLLHEAGLAPKLYATFTNGLVYEYVPGDVLTPENCRLPETYVLVARTLADMHSVNTSNGINQNPVLWDKLAQFLNLVPDKFTDPEKQKKFEEILPSKAKLQEEYAFMKKHLSVSKSPSVFCHNDLLLGNVVYNSQRNSVTFIDYEYAAYNYQAFDLANHFNEYAGVETVDFSLFPDEKYQKNWLRIYLERFKKNQNGSDISVSESEIQSLYTDVQKFTLASHYLWGIWALIQSEHSSIDFDFLNYSFIKINEYFNRKKKIFDC